MPVRAIPNPLSLPMILRNLRQVRLRSDGHPTIHSSIRDGSRDMRWFVPDPNLLVYEFELYFADSYRLYGIEYVRAPNKRAAQRKIKQEYPNVIEFKWER